MRLLNVIVLLAFSLNLAANERYERERNWTKTYKLSSVWQMVAVENRHGTLRIETWDRKEAKIEVVIRAAADKESDIESLLSVVDIKSEETDRKISAETRITDRIKFYGKGNKPRHSVTIDMTVTLPSTQPLTVINSFGPLKLGDHEGPVDLTSKFGSLKAGKLSLVTKIMVEFGELDISLVKGGDIEVKFSKGEIRQATGDIDLKLSFSKDVTIGMTTDLKSFDLKASYSDVYLEMPGGLDADFDITAKFGDFRNRTRFDIREQTDGEKSSIPSSVRSHRYTGKSGNGGIPVKVRSDFGDIILKDRANGVSS
jgi:hypothetical protein